MKRSPAFIGAISALTFTIYGFISIPNASALALSKKYAVNSPIGVDKQTKVFSTLFDIELWAASIPHDYKQSLTIRIRFATRFDRRDVVEFLADEAQEIHGFPDSERAALQTHLRASISCDPTSGAVLDFNYEPTQGISVSCNGVISRTQIPAGTHAFSLLDVFLHPDSEYQNLLKND